MLRCVPGRQLTQRRLGLVGLVVGSRFPLEIAWNSRTVPLVGRLLPLVGFIFANNPTKSVIFFPDFFLNFVVDFVFKFWYFLGTNN